jgi:hypothetical protein
MGALIEPWRQVDGLQQIYKPRASHVSALTFVFETVQQAQLCCHAVEARFIVRHDINLSPLEGGRVFSCIGSENSCLTFINRVTAAMQAACPGTLHQVLFFDVQP